MSRDQHQMLGKTTVEWPQKTHPLPSKIIINLFFPLVMSVKIRLRQRSSPKLQEQGSFQKGDQGGIRHLSQAPH